MAEKVRAGERLSARKWNALQNQVIKNQDRLTKLNSLVKAGKIVDEAAIPVQVVNKTGYDIHTICFVG